MCVRVRARVWYSVACGCGLRGVLIGPLIAWNRTNKGVRFFSWWVSRRGGVALFQVFQEENAFDLGVEMLFVRVSLGKMNEGCLVKNVFWGIPCHTPCPMAMSVQFMSTAADLAQTSTCASLARGRDLGKNRRSVRPATPDHQPLITDQQKWSHPRKPTARDLGLWAWPCPHWG